MRSMAAVIMIIVVSMSEPHTNNTALISHVCTWTMHLIICVSDYQFYMAQLVLTT